MSTPSDLLEHPLLTDKYVCLSRRECDENVSQEIVVPEIILCTSGKVERIFSLWNDAQDIYLPDVEKHLTETIQRLWITEMLSPYWFSSGQFLWYPNFINMDSDERREAGGEIQNWVEYRWLREHLEDDNEWVRFLREKGIQLPLYDIDSHEMISE